MAITKEELWRRYVDRNPHWLTDGATLTAARIKRLFDQTYDLGHQQGFENGRARAEMDNDVKSKSNPFADLFKYATR